MSSAVETENEHNSVTKITDSSGVVPIDYSIKHPLQNEWVLWYYVNDKKLSWNERQCKVSCFSTVEDFWSLYNNIILPSSLSNGSAYSLFKNDIRPAWEDERNRPGGIWQILVDKKQRNTDLDNYWLYILLSVIGETFDNNDSICGAVVNVRSRGDRVEVWTANAKNINDNKQIGEKIRVVINLPQRTQIAYISHEDAARDQYNPKISYSC